MLKQKTSYLATSAKVRVMYSRSLKEKDYAELLKKQTVSDIAGYLKKHPAYEKPLENINERLIHRGQLEGILKRTFYQESVRIFSFTLRDDKSFFANLILRLEIDEIVTCIRLLKAGRINEFILVVPEFIVKESKLDYVNMSKAENFSQLLDVMAKTEFKPTLEKFRNKELDITELEVALISYYYDKVFEHINKNFSGEDKKALLDSTGTQIDFQNITRIMRMKKFFNISPEKMKSYLIPHNYQLKESELNALISSKDEDELFSVLKSTSYKKIFNMDNERHDIEEYYDKCMYKLYHKLLRGKPSAIVPLSYLFLKDIEISNLINIIEGIRYKEDTSEIRRHLTGF